LLCKSFKSCQACTATHKCGWCEFLGQCLLGRNPSGNILDLFLSETAYIVCTGIAICVCFAVLVCACALLCVCVCIALRVRVLCFVCFVCWVCAL
jgi:hypothetical protein